MARDTHAVSLENGVVAIVMVHIDYINLGAVREFCRASLFATEESKSQTRTDNMTGRAEQYSVYCAFFLPAYPSNPLRVPVENT